MIFAVATKCSVYLYDTQQKLPFALISNIHYTRLTDMAWSNDGKILIVSSTDGFCSIITFADAELGEEYMEKSLAEVLSQNTAKENVKKSQKKPQWSGRNTLWGLSARYTMASTAIIALIFQWFNSLSHPCNRYRRSIPKIPVCSPSLSGMFRLIASTRIVRFTRT